MKVSTNQCTEFDTLHRSILYISFDTLHREKTAYAGDKKLYPPGMRNFPKMEFSTFFLALNKEVAMTVLQPSAGATVSWPKVVESSIINGFNKWLQ